MSTIAGRQKEMKHDNCQILVKYHKNNNCINCIYDLLISISCKGSKNPQSIKRKKGLQSVATWLLLWRKETATIKPVLNESWVKLCVPFSFIEFWKQWIKEKCNNFDRKCCKNIKIVSDKRYRTRFLALIMKSLKYRRTVSVNSKYS